MDNASPTPEERTASDTPPRPASDDDASGTQEAVETAADVPKVSVTPSPLEPDAPSPLEPDAPVRAALDNGGHTLESAGHVIESTDGEISDSLNSGNGSDTLDTGTASPDSVWSDGRLSSVDAEAFAASIRPSWHVDWSGAGSTDARNARVSAPPPSARGEAREEVDHGATVRAAPLFQDLPVPGAAEEPVIPGGRASGKMLGLVAVLFLAGIVVVGIAFLDEPEPPPAGQSGDPPTAAAAPVIVAPTVEPVTERAVEAELFGAVEPVPEEPALPGELALPAEPVAEPPLLTRLSLTVRPTDARLELDGNLLSGHEVEFPRDGESHVVRASAEGYREREVSVRFDRPRREIEIRLATIPAPRPVREATAPMRTTSMRANSPMRATPMRTTPMGTTPMGATPMGAGFTTDNPY